MDHPAAPMVHPAGPMDHPAVPLEQSVGEPKRSRLPIALGAAALVLAGMAGGGFGLLSRSDSSQTTSTVAPDTTENTDESSDTTEAEPESTEEENTVDEQPIDVPIVTGFEQVASFDVGAGPWTATVGTDVLWVPIEGGLVRIDLVTSELDTISIAGWSETPLVTDDAVWVPNTSEPTLTRVDPTDPSAEPVTISVGQRGFTPVLTEGAVWVPNRLDNTISRVDTETNESVLIDLGFDGVGLASVDGEVWVSTVVGLFALDADGVPTQISDFIPSGAAVAAAGSGWVVEAETGNVVRIDPATKQVSLIDVGGAATSLTPGPDAIWFLSDTTVASLDFETETVRTGPTIEGPAVQLSPTLGGSWVTSRAEVPMLYFLNDELEIVSELELDGVPDAPTVAGERMFLSLTRDGARVLEFTTLQE